MEKFILLEYRQIYDNEPDEIIEYIKELDFESLIEAGTFFLSASNPKSHLTQIEFFLKRFFSYSNNSLAIKIYKRVKDLEKNSSGNFIILNPEAALIFFETILSLTERVKNNPDEKIFEERVFKALLAINQRIVSKQETLYNHLDKIADEEKIGAQLIGMTLSYSEYVNTNITKLIISQFIKSFLFFEFCEKELPMHLKKFNEDSECNHWKDYIKVLMPAIMLITKMSISTTNTIVLQNENNDIDRTEMFFENIALKEWTTSGNYYDFPILRQQPVIKLEKYKYRIINDVFLIEKLFKSLYFQFREINDTLPENFRKSDFRSFF
jgi:hypothetical protein